MAFEHWVNPTFTICFLLTCIMGYGHDLIYSVQCLCSYIHKHHYLITAVILYFFYKMCMQISPIFDNTYLKKRYVG